jgi:hypothetical protein
MFRIQCANSLVCHSGTIESAKVRHSGDVAGKVIDATYTVLSEAEKVMDAPRAWGALELSRDERELFARAAHAVRFDAEVPEEHAIRPVALLEPRRRDDTGTDLWRTFNVVQENAIRGGLRGIGRDVNNRPRRTRTRAIKGIDQNVSINRALWMLADGMAKLKAAA